MTKAADDKRLREIGKQFEAKDLALHLETLGADASVFLRPAEERAARWGSAPPVYIPAAIADMIAAALLAVPRKRTGRRRLWLDRVYYAALLDLAAGKEVNVVAREIAKATGQPEGSCRRRLQELKAEGRVRRNCGSEGRVHSRRPRGRGARTARGNSGRACGGLGARGSSPRKIAAVSRLRKTGSDLRFACPLYCW